LEIGDRYWLLEPSAQTCSFGSAIDVPSQWCATTRRFDQRNVSKEESLAKPPAESFRECALGTVEALSVLMTGLQLAWLLWVAQYGSQTE